tara:strand:+ start:760 stop:1116 length:357 start_codon:yes stop_codon:yes gene_type:complete
MKKLTLSVGLLIGVMSMKAQDTVCTYFSGKEVFEFNFHTSEIISYDEQTSKYYEINLDYGDVLCLDFSDDKTRTRKVITTFFDGTWREDILDSKDNVYYSPRGAVKIQVGKPKFFNKL